MLCVRMSALLSKQIRVTAWLQTVWSNLLCFRLRSAAHCLTHRSVVRLELIAAEVSARDEIAAAKLADESATFYERQAKVAAIGAHPSRTSLLSEDDRATAEAVVERARDKAAQQRADADAAQTKVRAHACSPPRALNPRV